METVRIYRLNRIPLSVETRLRKAQMEAAMVWNQCVQIHRTGTESGTSSRCPECGHHQKVQGRVWHCRKCGFTGHRDIVGASNMHLIAFGDKIMFPQRITYHDLEESGT